MSGKYPFKEYLRQAFHNWYNYGLLILFGGLGLINGNLGWFLVGAALEIVALYNVAGDRRFQRYVDSVLEDEKELQVFGLRNSLWPYIADDLRAKYMDLEQLSARMRGDVTSFSKIKDPLIKDNIRKISVLLSSYLKLAVAVTRYRNYLDGVNESQIDGDIARLKKEMGGAEERVQEIKQKNIDILSKRLEKITKAAANVDYLGAQMETIADTMRLVVDQAITLSDPKGMSVQIDSLLTTLQDTDLIAAEMESLDELEAGHDEFVPRRMKE
jgi:hypothetical protein